MIRPFPLDARRAVRCLPLLGALFGLLVGAGLAALREARAGRTARSRETSVGARRAVPGAAGSNGVASHSEPATV